MNHLRLFVISMLFLQSSALFADDEQNRLIEVNETIAELQESMQAQRGEIAELETALANNEKLISDNARALANAETELANKQRELAELQNQVALATQNKERSEVEFGRILLQIWQQRESNGLSVLLSGDANEQQRLTYYYQVMSESQREALDAFRAEVETLSLLEAEQTLAVERVEEQRQVTRQQLFRLRQSQRDRETTLGSLRETVATSGSQIEQLQQERAQLERIIEELSRAIGSLSAPKRVEFRSLKGKLPSPSDGRLISRFGDTRNGHIKWRGHRYSAQTGEPVQSVAYGRVVYANWLSGQGLLIAVDHGDNYLTLYANNQSLLKTVGEWVEPGEVIATVGNSGGLDDSALYFEIRHNGQPLNPREWID